jgi:hypothetical protein
MKLAQLDQAQVGEVGLPIGIALRQRAQFRQMGGHIERHFNELLVNHVEDDPRVTEVKCNFREDGLACVQRGLDALRYSHRPRVVLIGSIGECDQESGIGNTLHRVKPLRRERSRGPRREPARRMYPFRALDARAFSS